MKEDGIMRVGWSLIPAILLNSVVLGQNGQATWSPIGNNSPIEKKSNLSVPSASLGKPQAATIGLPISARNPNLTNSSSLKTPVVRASSPDPLLGEDRPRSASLGIVSNGEKLTGITLGPVDDSPEEQYNWGAVTQPWKTTSRGEDSRNRSYSGLLKKWTDPEDGMGGIGGNSFQSDHELDNFISPITNPFFAEDPRRLTEIRPIFIYQTIPNSQYLFRGGNIQFFGLQGRLSLTERFSVVLHKLGGIVINPGGDSTLDNSTGLSEIWLGPKFTFYKNCESGTVAAAGAIFQIPVGPGSTFQDTGNFGIAPYVTVAQKFYRTSFGQFTVLDTLGYNFGTNNARSDFVYNTLHLNYDVANLGRIFPLVELNFFHYTSNGNARAGLDFEGRDLANIGASVSGRTFLSFAAGARFKISQPVEIGFAGEFPLNGTRDLLDFRFVVDLIWRF
jgi:hypothetical protein